MTVAAALTQLAEAQCRPMLCAFFRLSRLRLCPWCAHFCPYSVPRTVEALAGSCRETLATLDLSGCSGVARRSHEELRAVLPRLRCFVVHS